MNRTRRTITSPERDMILRVMTYFEEEKQNGTFSFPVSNVLNRTSRATGVSVTTVKRIRRDATKNHNKIVLPKLPKPPVKEIIITSSCVESSSGHDDRQSSIEDASSKRTPVKTYGNKTKYSDEVLKSLKQIVDSYIEANGKMMSLDDTLAAATEYLQFPVERGTLQKVLGEKLGYEFEDDYKKLKRKRRKGLSSLNSESELDDSGDESTEALEKECVVNGTETDNNDCYDPIMLCEVAIKEENLT